MLPIFARILVGLMFLGKTGEVGRNGRGGLERKAAPEMVVERERIALPIWPCLKMGKRKDQPLKHHTYLNSCTLGIWIRFLLWTQPQAHQPVCS